MAQESSIIRHSSPFDKKFMIRSISRRSICRLITKNDDWYGVISGMFEDDNGLWIQAVNITDVFELKPEDKKDFANLLVNAASLEALEFSDDNIYTIDNLTEDEATSIMNRTNKIVELTKEELMKNKLLA